MSFSVKSGGTDISDYVIGGGETVPYVDKNRDYTPVVSEITLNVSSAVSPSLVASGCTISVYSGGSSVPFYSGIIKESTLNKSTYTHEIRVSHILSKLNQYAVSYENVNHLINYSGVTTDQYMASDNQGCPHVQVVFLLRQMFWQCGLTLDTSYIENIAVMDIQYLGSPHTLYIKDLVIDENMLYVINQSVVCSHSVIDGNPDYTRQRWTFLDFFTNFCSMIGSIKLNLIGFNIAYYANNSIRLYIRDDSPYAPLYDVTYEDTPSKVIGSPGGYSYDVNFDQNRGNYKSSTARSIPKLATNIYKDGKNMFTYPNNLAFMFRNSLGNPGEVYGLDLNLIYPHNVLMQNKVRSETNDFNATNYTTNVDYIIRAKSSTINLKEQTATMIQEL